MKNGIGLLVMNCLKIMYQKEELIIFTEYLHISTAPGIFFKFSNKTDEISSKLLQFNFARRDLAVHDLRGAVGAEAGLERLGVRGGAAADEDLHVRRTAY